MNRSASCILAAMGCVLAFRASAADEALTGGYIAKVTLTCEGEKLASSMSEVGPDGTFGMSVHGKTPFNRAISVDGDGRQTRTIRDDLVTGADMGFKAHREGENLILDMEGEVSELKELRHYTAGVHAFDVPDVRRCAVKGTATARRDGDGWRLDGSGAPGGMIVSVVITPGTFSDLQPAFLTVK